jgi:hypothetical protein
VLASIHFDNELFFSTNKIHDVGSDRFLADELESTQPPVMQREPQFGLGICGLPAQVSLETNGSFLRSAHCLAPHPTLYPPREERGEGADRAGGTERKYQWSSW